MFTCIAKQSTIKYLNEVTTGLAAWGKITFHKVWCEEKNSNGRRHMLELNICLLIDSGRSTEYRSCDQEVAGSHPVR